MNTFKTLICSCIITAASFSAPCLANAKHFNNDTYLLKMGIANIYGSQSSHVISPSIALAKRFEIPQAAIEVSMQYAGVENDHRESDHFSLPKIMYLKFHTPDNPNTIYYGGGLSWSEVEQTDSHNPANNGHFEGIFLEGALGYEIHRDQKIRTTFELNISQPVVASSRQGTHPGPSIFASIGFGF